MFSLAHHLHCNLFQYSIHSIKNFQHCIRSYIKFSLW